MIWGYINATGYKMFKIEDYIEMWNCALNDDIDKFLKLL